MLLLHKSSIIEKRHWPLAFVIREGRMTARNFDRTLRAFVRRTPFRPFTIELVSGNRFEVDHPEALVFRHGVAAFVSAAGVPTLFDYESVSQLIGTTA
jgi:hypothetical protein